MNAIFQTATAEIVDSAEIRILFTWKPHKGDIGTKSIGNLTTSIEFKTVSIQKDFEKHTGMVGGSTTAGVSGDEKGQVKLINGMIDDTNKVVLTDGGV